DAILYVVLALLSQSLLLFFFFFNDTTTTEIYTLSLHDALPIYSGCEGTRREEQKGRRGISGREQEEGRGGEACRAGYSTRSSKRSEEHTSELQSPCNLVCRLLLEKKKK